MVRFYAMIAGSWRYYCVRLCLAIGCLGDAVGFTVASREPLGASGLRERCVVRRKGRSIRADGRQPEP